MATYNVRDFGAKGNGVHDDTDAIQAAIEAASNDGGGNVYIPEGTYIVSGHDEPGEGAIMMRDNVHVEGAGMGQTTLKVADGWDQKMTGVVRSEYGESNHDYSLKNLTIDGNRDNVDAKIDGWFNGYIPESTKGFDSNVLLENVEIKECSGYGFDPHEQTYNLTIRGSVAHDNGLDGFVADFIIGGVYEDNIAYDNDRHGFNVVTSTNDFVMKNNIAYGNDSAGIVIQRGSDDYAWPKDIQIIGGEIYDNGDEGILVKMSEEIRIEGVDIHDNGKTGIRLYGANEVDIIGNTLTNNSQAKDSGYPEIRLSMYDDSNGVSGDKFTTHHNTITNNVISATGNPNANYGIREYDDGSDYNILKGNSISGMQVDDIQLNGAHSSDDGTEPPEPTVPGGDDVYNGTSGADIHNGGGGDDTMTGNGGNDTLTGGTGKDDINGNSGNDSLLGGAGADTLEGSSGDDILFGNTNADLLQGGTGSDQLFGNDGDDQVLGNDGNDTVQGGKGVDAVDGGKGNDFVKGDTGHDVVRGGTGNDTVFGNDGNDRVQGDAGADSLYGGKGMDTLYGGSGNDTIKGDTGADVLYAGSGTDELRGGSGNDTLHSGGNSDLLAGGTGSDIFVFDSVGGTIKDFKLGGDKIDVTAFSTNFNALDIDVSGANSTVTFGADIITVQNFTDLDAGDFIF